ncbi:MAG: ATP-binding cassette domain-containing protein [Candidatus Freyarchaeota archaeon]|nr:ATP-binding cassette domain-containing protein [Candidatus Jordarchaeia archaeon]MBS7268792.1 ATP-binding cassette domain-containing protein [Candidatus Jordarchaeia archaeon]MBS7278224.1 ATP-binding cassette domain-containing protein [Candidatus Jordarchaeia archaeon]
MDKISRSVIEVENLTKYYGELRAVDHISFQVEEGKIFGFLGPNGAGKTTTVRMLTGVIIPDEGTARIMGYDILKEPIKAKEVMGIVPEASSAYVDLSAWSNLILIGELYGIPKKERERKAEELLQKFGLQERKNEKVKNFSRGMKQRLLICMALINSPQILFLDEPTTALDVQSARIIRDTLLNLNKDGATIFLTTHNMEEANLLCDEVAIINQGKIAAIDNPERLRTKIGKLNAVEVSFTSSPNLEKLAKIPSVREVKKLGDKVRLYTSNPGQVITDLADYTKENNLQITTLQTLAPTLEDIFIMLIEEGSESK